MPFCRSALVVIRTLLSIAGVLAPIITICGVSAASEMREVRQFDPKSGKWVNRRVDNSELVRRLNVAPVPPQRVAFEGDAKPGTVIVDTGQRRLLFINADGTATQYMVGVGREGFAWKGVEKISRKMEWPSWTPPEEMRRREAKQGRALPITMEGGFDNPLGARALYLSDTLYRIHGTNEPWTLGEAVSSGCIRMANDDIIDLYEKTHIGTLVVVK